MRDVQSGVYLIMSLAGLIVAGIALLMIRAREHQARQIRREIHQAK